MNAPVTRRALLGATAVLGAATLPAVALDLSADRTLIAEAIALKTLRARELAAWAALPDDHPDDFPPFVACGRMADEVREGGEALALLPAMSAAALRAKAEAEAEAMLALFGPLTWTEQEAVTEHHLLVVSLVRDAARLGIAGVGHA